MSSLPAEPPTWLLAAVAILAAALGLWVAAKVLKWLLWMLLLAVVAGGAVLIVWTVWRG